METPKLHHRNYHTLNPVSHIYLLLRIHMSLDKAFNYWNQNALQLQNVIDQDLHEIDIWKKWKKPFNGS